MSPEQPTLARALEVENSVTFGVCVARPQPAGISVRHHSVLPEPVNQGLVHRTDGYLSVCRCQPKWMLLNLLIVFFADLLFYFMQVLCEVAVEEGRVTCGRLATLSDLRDDLRCRHAGQYHGQPGDER